MSLHRLTQIVMGVPNVEQTAASYTEFGLTPRRSEEVSVWGVVTPAPTGDHTPGAWGTPPPASFLAPENLAGMMTGAHGAR